MLQTKVLQQEPQRAKLRMLTLLAPKLDQIQELIYNTG